MRSLLLLATLAVALGLPAIPGFTCRPGQACWPSALEWKIFNKTIGGNLHATVPIGAPCFPSSPFYNITTCNTIKANYKDASFRQSFSGNGLEYTNFESCGNFSCLPSVYGPQTANCSLGRLSSYFVKVQHRLHVAATVAFATLHNIRLVIRNTGHDYLGRSSSANSLALITQDLKAIQIVEKFKAFNCPAADGSNVGIIGAGVVSSEAAAYFNSKGFAVAAGSCPSVGTAGGFGQTAGHGLYARGYGLMVDLAVEFDVMTVEGQFLTINRCNNPDLFWAMRGGGGSSYAILLNYKFKLIPLQPIAMYVFRATFTAPASKKASDSPHIRPFVTRIAQNELRWAANNMSGSNWVGLNIVETYDILPVGRDPLAVIRNLTASYRQYMLSLPNITVVEDQYKVFSSQAEFANATSEVLGRRGSVGVSPILSSRLVPSTHFKNDANISLLVDAILAGMDSTAALGGTLSVTIHKTTPANNADSIGATSTNPGWRNANWFVIMSNGWVQGLPDSYIQMVTANVRSAIRPLIALTATSKDKYGLTYGNEADYQEENWKEVFFGGHYEKLLAVKRKYDPLNVLNCWRCVGFIGEMDPMYSCFSGKGATLSDSGVTATR
ncbi:hypothetical protein PROFUN_02793 [Planoprotostelium fungivorum]|uniref:FAD-binding PCMH-type domain-containing protein n=1 Tax=Planoprotostelium fungivorum TaxID=1890364 RepID=A0A2P6NXL2_9EUKA|nr:hypothetical protein PROFUN_02793 [Planoprotostelium fungivorum]